MRKCRRLFALELTEPINQSIALVDPLILILLQWPKFDPILSLSGSLWALPRLCVWGPEMQTSWHLPVSPWPPPKSQTTCLGRPKGSKGFRQKIQERGNEIIFQDNYKKKKMFLKGFVLVRHLYSAENILKISNPLKI